VTSSAVSSSKRSKKNITKRENERNFWKKPRRITAAGDYAEALEAISSVEIGGFGNSSDLYDFNCGVLFYRMVALGEHALSSLDFNFEAQRREIDSSLTMAADVMRRSPERRSDVRDLAMKLQHRVVAKYLGGLPRLYQEYAAAEIRLYQEYAAAEMGVANVKSQSSLQLVQTMCTNMVAGKRPAAIA
jgi:hypothetical protein